VGRVLRTALLINLAVAAVKLTVGTASGSLALLADAMHSINDSLASLLGLLSNRLSDPRPDRDHPYGHHKYEAVGALAIAAFIVVTSLEIVQAAFERLMGGLRAPELGLTELVLLLGVLVCNLVLATYERRAGRRLGSALLLADAQHTASDIWTTVLVLSGLLASRLFGIVWLDVALAVPIAALLLWACWQVLRANLPWLVDQIAIPPEHIHAEVMQVPGVVNCHAIASRGQRGQQVFVDMHLVVEAEDVRRAHAICDAVEERLRLRHGPLRCTIHLEPRDHAESRISFGAGHE
jgi:cation diffusion facilitator family transporter